MPMSRGGGAWTNAQAWRACSPCGSLSSNLNLGAPFSFFRKERKTCTKKKEKEFIEYKMAGKKWRHPLFEINHDVRRRPSFAEGYQRTDEEKERMRLILETAQKVTPYNNNKKKGP